MVCTLREWRPEDASALAALLNNKKIQDNLRDGIPFPYTKLDAAVFIGQMLERDPHALYAFAVTADGALAGSISVARQRNIHSHTGELGYYIGEPFWGAGAGTECGRCAATFLHTRISSGSLPSRFPTTRPPAAFWKKTGSVWRARCGKTPAKTAACRIWSCMRS